MANLIKDDNLFENLNINESIEYNNLKQTLSGGIDPERLINEEYLSSLGDFYKCSICFKIMINPTDCEECGHSYCKECISKLKCPFGCKKKLLKNSSIGIYNLLKNLNFNCPNKGCDAIIPYNDVKNHDINCQYQKVSCPNKRCKKRIIKKDLENHIKNICKYTQIECKYCHTEYYRKEIIEHEKLCSLTFQYLKNYNNKESEKTIISDIHINEKNFNKYMQSLSVNISKILKQNNNFKINDKNNENNGNIKSNDKTQDNNNIIEDKKIINKKDEEIKDENINKNKSKIIDESNNNKNDNDESKQSLAQIEEDDLVDIIKKALEEKLNEKFSSYNINLNTFYQNLNEIKNCVCKLNTIEEVKESEEEDNDDEEEGEINNIKKSKDKISSKEKNTEYNLNDNIEKNEQINNLKIIRDDLKGIVDSVEQKIKNSIIQLNLKLINTKNIHNTLDNNYNEEEEKISLANINQNIENFSIKIINAINEAKIKINDIKEKLEKNNNNSFNIKSIEKNCKSDDYQNIIKEVKNILQNIIEKNNINFLNQEINKINKENEISIEKVQKNKVFQNIINYSDINNSIDNNFLNVNKEIKEIHSEIELISKIFQNLKTTLLNQLNDSLNEIKINKYNKNIKRENLIKEISFQFYNNKKQSVYLGIRPLKSTQQSKIKSNINIINPLNLNVKNQKLKSKFNSTEIGFPLVKTIEENDFYNRSYSSNSYYFYNSDKNIHDKKIKENLIIDNDILKKLLNIELKIKNINEFFESIPELVKKKVDLDIFQRMLKLKEKFNKCLEDKLKNMFSLKYCEKCEKIEYFFGFKKCSFCQNYCCKNCIILCSNCKHFCCKICFQKNNHCLKLI